MRIRFSDVDQINGILQVKLAKSGKWSERKFYFNLENYVKTYKPKQYLFEGCYNTAQVMIYRLIEICELKRPLTVHSYRSGCITYLSDKEMTIQDISDYIGHERIDTTMRYRRTSKQ